MQFEDALQKLYQYDYDPVVEIDMDAMSNGCGGLRQHTITCLGELHLEQCLKSLTERFSLRSKVIEYFDAVIM